MKKTLFTIGLMLCLLSTYAQRAADQTLMMESSISALTQNALTGIIVIKEGENIHGIDPTTKKDVWKITKDEIGKASLKEALLDPDLLNLVKDKESLKAVPGTPYVEGTINYKFVLINTENGKLVYNSGNDDFTVLSSEILYEDNQYLFFVSEKKKISALLVDLNTGQQIWKTEIGEFKGFLSGLMSVTGGLPPVDKAVANADKIFSLNKGVFTCLDRATGKLMWQSKEKYTNFFPNQNGLNVVVTESKGAMSAKEYLSVLSVKDGKGIWDEPIKTKKVVYVEDWGDKVLIAHYNGFNFFDLKSGKKVWDKDARGEMVKKVIPLDKDFLYVAENEMMLINEKGEKKWKKFIEISDNKEDAIIYLDKVGDKVFYLTQTYGNMVDYKSGIKLWKRNIKFNEKRPVLSAYDSEKNQFLVYNDEKLFKFDPNIEDKPDEFAKVNIKNENELNNISLFPWGVALTGPVEVMGVGMDGKEKYHRVYKQPGEGQRKLIKGAAMLGSAYLGVSSGVSAIQGAEWRMTYRDADGNIRESVVKPRNDAKNLQAGAESLGSAMLGDVVEKYGKRFNALKQNADFAYIFAKGENNEQLLVKVKKEDGAEVDKLLFSNMRPVFEIDDATQNVFYVNGKSLDIYEAKK